MLLFNSKALFDMYRNLQPHRAVLPAIAWHLVIYAIIYPTSITLLKLPLYEQ